MEGMKEGIITFCCVDVEVVVAKDEIGVVKMGVIIRGAVGIEGICTWIETTGNFYGTKIVGIYKWVV